MLRRGHHDGAHVRADGMARQELGGDAHVFDPAVRAAADDALVDADAGQFGDGLRVLGQVRRRDGRRDAAQVDVEDALVCRVLVGGEDARLVLRAAFHVGERLVVHGEDAVLGACLDRHVADAEAVVHGQLRHARAGEFHALVQRAVHADHADDMQDDVLAGHPGRRRAGQVELEGGRDAEPCPPRGDAGGQVGRSDTGRKRTQGTVGAGVAIGADDGVARGHKPLLRQERMLDAHRAHVVEVDDAVLEGELAHFLALLGALDVLVGREVVHDKRDLGLVEDLLEVRLAQHADGYRAGDVVGEREVDIGLYKLARHDGVEARMRGQNFLRHGHSHEGSPFGRVIGWRALRRRLPGERLDDVRKPAFQSSAGIAPTGRAVGCPSGRPPSDDVATCGG